MSQITDRPIFVRNTFWYHNGKQYIRHLKMAAAPAEKPSKDKSMATQATVFTAGMAAAKAMPMSKQVKRRSIDPKTGHALVVLGHALEYLTDEYIHEGGTFTSNRGQVDAIQLLIRLNREIYMSCPEAPTFKRWLGSLLHRPVRESELHRHGIRG